MSTVYSARLEQDLHLGKQPPKPLVGAVKYSELRRSLLASGVTLPTPPAHFGHGGDFKGGRWLMLGNGPDDTVFPGFQGCGDCAWAGPAHEEMEAARNSGRPIPVFSGGTIVDQYSAYSGYDPRTGANDTGSAISDVITWRQTKGIYDDSGIVYKIGQSIELEPGNLDELWEAVFLFENAGIGIVVCTAQMDQFDAHQAWDYVPGSPQEGGHYAPGVGRASLDNSGFITWAVRWGFTRRFYEKQNDETVCYLDDERYSAVTGETLESYTDADLEKYLALVAREKLAA